MCLCQHARARVYVYVYVYVCVSVHVPCVRVCQVDVFTTPYVWALGAQGCDDMDRGYSLREL